MVKFPASLMSTYISPNPDSYTSGYHPFDQSLGRTILEACYLYTENVIFNHLPEREEDYYPVDVIDCPNLYVDPPTSETGEMLQIFGDIFTVYAKDLQSLDFQNSLTPNMVAILLQYVLCGIVSDCHVNDNTVSVYLFVNDDSVIIYKSTNGLLTHLTALSLRLFLLLTEYR